MARQKIATKLGVALGACAEKGLVSCAKHLTPMWIQSPKSKNIITISMIDDHVVLPHDTTVKATSGHQFILF
jgi:hypothetical protein